MNMKSLWIVGIALLGICLLGVGCSSSSDPLPAPQQEEPLAQQTVVPAISAISIGVPDLEAATEFYVNAIGMRVLDEGDYPDYLDQEGLDIVVLMSQQQGRGTTLVLMHDPEIEDPAYYTDNPDKLVFVVPYGEGEGDGGVDDFYNGILANGGKIVGEGEGTPPTEMTDVYGAGVHIGLAYDLNGYLIEMLEFSPSEYPTLSYITNPFITGVGIGASAPADSKDFYIRMLGMKHSTDLDVPGFMDEIQLSGSARPDLVLMTYDNPNGDNYYSNNPVKLIFSVDDAEAFFGFIEAEAPDQIVAPLTTLASGALSGFVLDPDGTKIQVVQPVQ